MILREMNYRIWSTMKSTIGVGSCIGGRAVVRLRERGQRNGEEEN